MMEDPKLISNMLQEIDPVEKEFVRLSMGIALQAKLALKKSGMTQADFAVSLGKKESEVSRWFGGMHNLTLYSIARLHVALGHPVFNLETPSLRQGVSIKCVGEVNQTFLSPAKDLTMVWSNKSDTHDSIAA